MYLEKLINLESTKKNNVNNLHNKSFLNDYTPLKLQTTYVFFNDDSKLLGYCEIDLNNSVKFSNIIFSKQYPHQLTTNELNICNGLYLKYIAISPQFQRKGYGKRIMHGAINQIRIDKRFEKSSLSSSVTAICREKLHGYNFFKKNEFDGITKFRIGNTRYTLFQKYV